MSYVYSEPVRQKLVELFLTDLKGVFYRHQTAAELLTPEVTKSYVDAWTPINGVEAITDETIRQDIEEGRYERAF